jgi:hypothetical protein
MLHGTRDEKLKISQARLMVNETKVHRYRVLSTVVCISNASPYLYDTEEGSKVL